MTPRGTDWGLALVVALLFATGMVSLFAASPDDAWVFVAHDVLAFALAGLLVVKMRRVWRRLVDPAQWDRLVKAGVLATLFVAAALVSGWLWSGGGRISIAGLHAAVVAPRAGVGAHRGGRGARLPAQATDQGARRSPTGASSSSRPEAWSGPWRCGGCSGR